MSDGTSGNFGPMNGDTPGNYGPMIGGGDR
jgi:hypothetical protein